MGCLWIRDCGNCKHLEEAVTRGVCRATDHTVEYTGDGEAAETCPYYENRWGYKNKKAVPSKEDPEGTAAEDLMESKEEKRMPRYGISIREILKRTVIAEAESVEEAVEKVEAAVEREEIILEAEDFDGREIVPSEYWRGGRIPDGEDVSCYWQLDGRDSGI